VTIDARHPLPGTRALVVGAARSGVAVAKLLMRHGVDVVLADRRALAELPEPAHTLAGPHFKLVAGRDDPALLEGRDFVVWSPGIPIDHPTALGARARHLPLLSELEIGYLAAHAPFLCVTGTNGKSTTTDLVGALLRAAGREVAVCGNIGRAVCEVAEDVSASGLLAVEVSSFQLESVDRLKPFVATWLNLTPDHLERHGTLDHYGALKARLFARQDEGDYAVWNADDPEVSRHRAGGGTWLEFSTRRAVEQGAYAANGEIVLAWRGGTERLLPAKELKLLGAHNLANALAALATVMPLEPPPDVLRSVLRTYGGLEHRLEPVATVEGVRFVNDSKATNIDSMTVALQSFDRPVVLIAGGRDKGQDFAPMARLAAEKVTTAVLIGEGAEKMAKAWPKVRTVRAPSLEAAVDAAFLRATKPDNGAKPSDTVLLSPGCASFDMFADYEDRGRQFKAAVQRLRTEGVVT